MSAWPQTRSSQFTLSPCHLVTLSPCHLVTLSPCHLVTLSPCHLVTLSSALRNEHNPLRRDRGDPVTVNDVAHSYRPFSQTSHFMPVLQQDPSHPLSQQETGDRRDCD